MDECGQVWVSVGKWGAIRPGVATGHLGSKGNCVVMLSTLARYYLLSTQSYHCSSVPSQSYIYLHIDIYFSVSQLVRQNRTELLD